MLKLNKLLKDSTFDIDNITNIIKNNKCILNNVDKFKLTPLYHLTINPCMTFEILKLLVSYGANFKKRNNGNTIFMHICKHPKLTLEILQFSIEYIDDINEEKSIHTNAFLLLCQNINVNIRMIKLFLDHGFNINSIDTYDKSPLYHYLSAHTSKIYKYTYHLFSPFSFSSLDEKKKFYDNENSNFYDDNHKKKFYKDMLKNQIDYDIFKLFIDNNFKINDAFIIYILELQIDMDTKLNLINYCKHNIHDIHFIIHHIKSIANIACYYYYTTDEINQLIYELNVINSKTKSCLKNN